MIAPATLMPIIALLLSAATLNLGLGLQATLLGVRAEIEMFATPAIGIIMSSYYLGFIAGSFAGPTFVNRVGHIRTFSALASIASAATLCHAVIIDPVAWSMLRAVTGFCFAGLCMVVESWLNENSTRDERGTILSIYMAVILGATAAGQLLFNIAAPSSHELFIVVSVVLSLALVPLALTTSVTPAQLETRWLGPGRLFDISPVGCIGTLGAGLITGAFWNMGAVYARQTGLSTFDISLFMTLLIAGGLFTLVPLGRLSDRMDRRIVIVSLNACICIVSAVMSFGDFSGGPWIFGIAAIFGGLALPLYSLSIALANDSAESVGFVPLSSGLLLFFGVGAAVGPTVAAGTMQAIGPHGLFIYSGGVAVLVTVFTLCRMALHLPAEERTEFVAMPRTTAVAYEMASPVIADGADPSG